MPDQYEMTRQIAGVNAEGPDVMPALFRMPFGWEAYGAEAGFTGRGGGVSPAPWDSLNLSFSRPDSPEHVMENHRRLSQAIGHPLSRCVRARQVHGAQVVRVTGRDAGIAPSVPAELEGMDALVTDEPGLVLLTSHADCVPVYFLDPAHHAIGLAHAGWAGVLAGVVEATVAAMAGAFGTQPAQLRVGIGPHIRSCCFEVGTDVADRFSSRAWWDDAFAIRKDGRCWIDLARCILATLRDSGVTADHVRDVTRCTRCESDVFFSHRGGGGLTGTNAAWLVLGETESGPAPATLKKTVGKWKSGIRKACLPVMLLCGMLAGCGAATPPTDGAASGMASAAALTGSGFGMPSGRTAMASAETGTAAADGAPVAGLGEVLLEDAGPAPGGTLRLFLMPVDGLDPLASSDPAVGDLGWFLSDPLVRIGEKGNVQPCLATGIRASQEGRLWDFSLVDGVRFHDGSLLEAADAVASIEHAAGAAQGPYAAGLANVEKVEAVGRLKVRIILKVSDPMFTRHLALPVFPASAWKTGGDGEIFSSVGVGAYRFALRDAEGITLVRADGWWLARAEGGAGHAAWPDRIRFVFGRSEADRLTLFQQRRIDATWSLDADMSRFLNRNDIEVRTFAGNRAEFLAVGAKSTMLQRSDIRAIVFRYLSGCLSSGGLKGDPVQDGLPDPVNAQTALQMLVEAGCRVQQKGDAPPVLQVPASTGMRQAALTIRYNALNLDRLGTAEWLSTQLAGIGVSVFRQEATVEDSKKLAANGQFDILLLGCEAASGTPDGDLGLEMRAALGTRAAVADVLPLYRERLAMLYSARIRGEKRPTAVSLYGGWTDWYMIGTGAP